MVEIYEKIKSFLDNNKKGVVHLVYPDLFENSAGIEINKRNIDNKKKLQFCEEGIMIFNTLEHSVITGKHLYLFYGNCAFVFIENGDEYNDW